MDDRDIPNTWMSDSNIGRVNPSYIAEMSEYIWYVTVIHNLLYILTLLLLETEYAA